MGHSSLESLSLSPLYAVRTRALSPIDVNCQTQGEERKGPDNIGGED